MFSLPRLIDCLAHIMTKLQVNDVYRLEKHNEGPGLC
jgi:hypothetical protein